MEYFDEKVHNNLDDFEVSIYLLDEQDMEFFSNNYFEIGLENKKEVVKQEFDRESLLKQLNIKAPTNDEIDSVITSYSIHYTKLYERILDSIIFLIFSFFVIVYFALSGVVYTQAFVIAWFLVMSLTVTIIYLAMHKEWAFKITLQIAKIVTKFSSKTLNEQKIRDTINKFQKTMIFFKGNRKGMLTSLFISSIWWLLDIFRIYVLFIAISTNVAFISVASTYLVALLVA